MELISVYNHNDFPRHAWYVEPVLKQLKQVASPWEWRNNMPLPMAILALSRD